MTDVVQPDHPARGRSPFQEFAERLVAKNDDRLSALLSASPWAREFMDNTLPAFGYAMREIWGDQLKGVPTYSPDGTPTGSSVYDDMFRTDGPTEEEARRRARRGPGLDPDDAL